MAVFRSKKGQFEIIPHRIIRDKNLSLRDIGLLVKLLSLPDGWEFSENGLIAAFGKDGQTTIRSGLKSLEEHGYLTRKRVRSENGQLGQAIWTIYDEAQDFGKPNFENQSLDSVPQSITDSSSTELSSTEMFSSISPDRVCEKRKTRFSPPTVEEVRAYCQERGYGVNPETFVNYYQSNGWMVGRYKMKDWKASISGWASRDAERNKPQKYVPPDYGKYSDPEADAFFDLLTKGDDTDG